MIPLSSPTRQRVRVLFPEGERARVESFLAERCGDNLPLVQTAHATLAERIRFAVLKLSNGDWEALQRHATEAARDWRDVLVAAGFASSIGAHLQWMPRK